ncbi:MAG: hypothetical protein GX174_00460, partial [Lentisphaerae bacterium]|nr:hypothetical protein [Lentisphaerota bacterium]
MKRALALSLSSNCMRRARMLVAALAALPLIASAAPVWTASTWTWGEFTPVANNLIAGIKTTGNIAILTDGVLEKGNTYAQYTGNGASYKWELPEPANVREVRIFTTWNDIGRVDISINSIIATLEGGTTATLSPGAHSNTLRAPSGYPFSSLKDSTGALLAQKVTAITVNFGTQQNGGVGYGEIEVVGTATNLNFVTVSSSGAECDTPLLGSFSGYGDFSVPRNQQITATVPLSGSSDTMKWTLEGWTLTETDAAGTVTTTQNGTANTNNCTFMPAEGCCYNLKWRWDFEYLVTASADSGLSASASVTYADIGDTVTISATEDTAPFLAWEGNVPAANKFDLSFTTTVTGPMTFTAKKPSKIYYVAPGGTGDGTSWAAAFGTIQAAVTAGSATNNVLVCVKEGGFLQTTAVTATGVGPLLIRGGYAGVGFTMGGATVVGRQTLDSFGNLVQCTLFSFSGSTVALESMTITNGFSRTVYYGQAVSLLNTCTAKIKNCTFTENGPGGQNDTVYYGGAVGAQNGTLVIDGCMFTRNRINGYGGNNNNTQPRGGAVGANAAAVTIRDSTFDGNWTQHIHTRALGGGALGFVDCTSLDLVRCNFTTNYARRSSGTGNHPGHDNGPYGGTLMVMGATKVSIADCTFIGSWNNSAYDAYPYHLWGGTIYLRGAKTAMSRCIVYNTGDSGGMTTYNRGGIDILGGELYMTNVLHAFAYGGNALGNSEPYGGYTGGKIEAVNCTFAGGRGNGNQNKAVYVQAAGSATFRNCIFWNNAGADVDVVNGDVPVFEYCITSTAHDGPGNSTADPLLADTRYCHPRSQAGRYNGGWFAGGAWVTNDTATSASIDAG